MPNAIRPDISDLSKQQSRLLIKNHFIGSDTLRSVSVAAKKEASLMLLRQLEAIKQITDQDFLKEIALSRRATALCERAALQITDQAYLREINSSSASAKVRAAAVSGIVDQRLLMRLMLRDFDHNVVDAACAGFKDQRLMARYLVSRQDTPKNDFRRKAILRHITEQGVLKEMAYYSDVIVSGSSIATDVLMRIDDMDFVKDIVDIYLHSQKRRLKPAIFQRIDDQDFLKRVAKDGSVPLYYRADAASRIKDSAFLVSALSEVLKTSSLFADGAPIKLKHNLSKDELEECKFISGAISMITEIGFIESLGKDFRVGLLLGDLVNGRLSELKEANKQISDLKRGGF